MWPKPRGAWSPQVVEAAGKDASFARDFGGGGGEALLVPPGPRNCERVQFCGFKPPSVW